MQNFEFVKEKKSDDLFLDVLQGVIESIDSFVLIKDEKSNFILANEQALKSLDFLDNQSFSLDFEKKYTSFVSQAREKDLSLLLEKSTNKDKSFQVFPSVERKEGVPVHVKKTVIENPIQKTKFLMCVYTDRSDYAALEKEKKELSKSSHYLNEASQAKDRFLATVSHEIRTPLNIICGCIDLLSDMNPEEKAKSLSVYIEKMSSSAQHLSHLIEDVLNISLIENNQLRSSPSRFNVKKFFEETVGELSILGAKKGKKVYLDLSLESLDFVTDKKFLRQVVFNLVSNSFKYSGVSDCRVKVVIEKEELFFKVSDKGVGMSPDDLSRVFEPFYQIKNPETISKTGVGLGLSLVNKLVDEIKGSIKIDSALNRGTAVKVKLPRLTQIDEFKDFNTGDINYKEVLKNRRLLVVEDDPDNRFVFDKYLSGLGAHIEFAEDGFEGWSKYKNAETDLDLMLIDLRMPKLNGYELMAKIRKWESENKKKHVPAICLSANVSKIDQDRALLSGFDEFVKKPVAKIELLEKSAMVILKKINGEQNV